MMTLYGPLTASALILTPISTVLLITNPGLAKGSMLSIRACTTIEVDPDVEQAVRLRRWCLRNPGHVNPRVPEGGNFYILEYGGILADVTFSVFNVEAAEDAVKRVKFTLGDIDEM